MLRNFTRFALLTAVLVLAGLPAAAQQADTGSADFSRYVAIGDSLTAGVNSASLVQTVQRTSYPALIFRQARGTTTGFEQPLVSEPGIPAGLVLRTLAPSFGVKPGTGQPLNLTLGRPYSNLGVPGARIIDIPSTTSGGAFDLVLRNPAFHNTTVLQQALSLQPTFVTLWIGNNDVLAAATSGRVIEGVTLTPVDKFRAALLAIVTPLRAGGAKLAMANIPNVTSIPFVTTIRPIVINPQTQQPVLISGQTVPLIGPSGLLAANDHVLLTAAAQLNAGRGIPAQLGGSGLPLTDDVVLSAQETATINARVDAYNAILRQVATDAGAAFVDVHEQLQILADTGVSIGGITYSEAFLTGGVFSYDGVHPTTFGYAYIANLFIDAINGQYGAEIPEVDLFPFVFGPTEVVALPAVGNAEAARAPELSPESVRNLFWTLGLSDPASGPATPRERHGRRNKPGRGGRR